MYIDRLIGRNRLELRQDACGNDFLHFVLWGQRKPGEEHRILVTKEDSTSPQSTDVSHSQSV